MTEIHEVVSCDGTCGLSPADCATLHPDPMAALRAQLAGVIGRAMILRTSPTEVADAVITAIEAHPSLTIRHHTPSKWAYDAACKALEEHRARADEAEAELRQLRQVGQIFMEKIGSTCAALLSLDQAITGIGGGPAEAEVRVAYDDLVTTLDLPDQLPGVGDEDQ